MQPVAPAAAPAAYASHEDEARRKREEATFNPPDYFREFLRCNHGTQDQERYNRRSLEIVNAAAEAVKAQLKDKKDPVQIFRDLLERLASERQKLAKELGSKNAEMFGQWMDRDGSDSFIPGREKTRFFRIGMNRAIKVFVRILQNSSFC